MTKERFHIGLRIIKTGIAVFLSILITGLIKGEAFYAVIAAVICLRKTQEDSYHIGRERVLGTILGGLFGMVVLDIFNRSPLMPHGMTYNILLTVGLMFLIKLLSLIKRTDAISIACVVYLSILVTPMGEPAVLPYAVWRIIETLIGVVIAVAVNRLLPNHRIEKGED